MSRIIKIVGLAFTVFSAAGTVGAQEPAFGGSFQPRIVQGVAQAPHGTFYVGGYSSPGGTQRHVVHFYAIRDPNDRSPEGVTYVSIPIASRILETGVGGGPRLWADGRNCSALCGVMYEFTRLAPPLFHAPRFNPEPTGAPRLGALSLGIHTGVVSLWGYARQADGAPMTMMLTGSDGIIARWATFAEDQLADCWSPEGPRLQR